MASDACHSPLANYHSLWKWERFRLPPAEPGPAAASGPLLLALSPNPEKPKQDEGFPAVDREREQNPARSRCDKEQHGAGSDRKIPIFLQAVVSKGSEQCYLLKHCMLRDVTFKPPAEWP